MARQALLDQIQYNKQKRELEKIAEKQVGKVMIHNAKESLVGENQFMAIKKNKATMAMRN